MEVSALETRMLLFSLTELLHEISWDLFGYGHIFC